MRKIFSLLLLGLLCSIGTTWGADYEWSHDGQQSTLAVSAQKSGNAAASYTNYSISYGGETYTSAVKMESATTITFTISATSDITIGIALKSGTKYAASGKATVKLTDTGSYNATSSESAISVETTGATSENGVDVTFTDVAPGTVTISRGGAELGVFYIKVHETGASLTELSEPSISFVAATGAVTIGSVANATKVTYTIDGSTPTASSTEYTAPFVVEDGTIVNAIAIGDGVSFMNSSVATETVYLTGITCATPVIKSFNGTIFITTTTPNATIKFSTDGGANYTTFTRAITLVSDATIKAHAERTGCTNSSDAIQAVSVIATNKTRTVYLDYDDFNISSYSATGKTGTSAEGFILTIGNTSKSWSSNSVMLTTTDGEKKSFKLSNGAQNTLTIPDGVHVTKLTLYSAINSAKNSTPNGWKEVAGEDYQTGENDYKIVPMGAYSDVDDSNTIPDIRVYEIDQTAGTITFTNAGDQLHFVVGLDILEDNVSITPSSAKSTYVTTTALNFSGVAGLTAYVASSASADAVSLTQVTTVPAGTPLILVGTADTEYTVPVVASAAAPAVNLLVAGTGAAINSADLYVLSLQSGNIVFASTEENEAIVPVGKAYLDLSGLNAAPVLRIVEGENNATNIENLDASEKAVKFIKNGQLFIQKDGVVYTATGAVVK